MEEEKTEGKMHPSFLKVIERREKIKQKLAKIKHKIGVYSAKGGVGKTTTAVNIAYTLSRMGFKVGILDADIDCPNVAMFVGITEQINVESFPMYPVEKNGVKIISTAMVVDEVRRPIIWRGPMVSKMITEFLENTEWGDLDYLIIDLPPGCLPAGTFVLMADNHPKPIEEVKRGEFVYSYENKKLVKNRVLELIPQGKQPTFKIKTPNRTIIASGNHPFLKYNWSGVTAWKRLDELKVRDRIVVVNCIHEGQPLNLPKINESKHNTATKINIPKFTTTDFMKIVGHFVGDGYVKFNHKRNKIIGLRICEPENSRFRDKYMKLYKEAFSCNIFKDGKTQFAIDSLPLVKLFRNLDLDHAALQKRVPDWVFSLPLEQRAAFIEGYSEADGHIRHRETEKKLMQPNGQISLKKIVQDTISLSSTNEILIKQLHELCQISGFRATNVRSRFREGNFIGKRKIKSTTNYEMDYSQKPDYSKFKLARIKAIEPTGLKETYDLQLAPPHNFVANNIIVHNTSDAPLTIMQTLPMDGFVIVTNPQKIAAINSTKSGLMAKRLSTALLGVIENMSSGTPSSNTREVVEVLQTDFLGTIKMDASFNKYSDEGKVPVLENPELAKDYAEIVKKLIGK
jgi:Mrp family chromosome partitioning ATPase/intein/homing endonuclease